MRARASRACVTAVVRRRVTREVDYIHNERRGPHSRRDGWDANETKREGIIRGMYVCYMRLLVREERVENTEALPRVRWRDARTREDDDAGDLSRAGAVRVRREVGRDV